MKKLQVNSLQYQYLEINFKQWLQIIGYAKSTVYSSPVYLREFFHYMEQQGKDRLHKINPEQIKAYYKYLHTRKNTITGGSITGSYINKHLQALKNFSRYLKETGQGSIEINLQHIKQAKQIKHIYNKEEIKRLYSQCDESILGLRDKAMLSVFYACGLRRNEGVQLDVQDIYTDRVYVKSGKNNKERYVPFTKAVKENLYNYMDQARPQYRNSNTNPAFFLSARGRRIDGQSLCLRLSQLCEKAGVNKEAGLHTLRHSIATHLLESGMKLHRIAHFLGHSSLESTQIYTHIVNER